MAYVAERKPKISATPLVSIVTPCFNSVQFIDQTIQSVLSQGYSPIEYIVMDGGSTDGTVELARRYESRLTLISEKDRGQADAINKGWRRAKGDILAWLNADDLYAPNAVQTAVRYLNDHPEAAWVYGYSHTLDAQGRPNPVRNMVSGWRYENLLTQNIFVTQPTVFLRRQVIEEFGYLRDDLHFGMDYEYWLRIGRQYPGHLIPEVLASVKWYRNTKTSGGGARRLIELKRLAMEYGAADLPHGMQHEWTESYLGEFFSALSAGKRNEAQQNLKEALHYPATVPRGFAKLLLRWWVPPRMETWLRQRLVRQQIHRY